MLPLNSVFQGDCLDLLWDVDDSSIDLIICDLPYGLTAPKWDSVIDMNELWRHYHRIIKSVGTILLFSCQPFTTMLIGSNLKDFRYCWYWIKNQGTNFFHAKRMPIRKVEEICVFKKGKYHPQKIFNCRPTNSAKGCSNGRAYHGTNQRDYEGGETTRYPNNVLKFKCVDNYSRIHSSEKPVKLLEYLIRTYSDEGDLILDNCAGSGSTGEACLKTSRNFILMEKEMVFYEQIKRRLHIAGV